MYDEYWDTYNEYLSLTGKSSEEKRSWVDGLDDKWNAYRVFRTDTEEDLALLYRLDLCFEFVRLLNESMGIPAWWSPDLDAGMRAERGSD